MDPSWRRMGPVQTFRVPAVNSAIAFSTRGFAASGMPGPYGVIRICPLASVATIARCFQVPVYTCLMISTIIGPQ